MESIRGYWDPEVESPATVGILGGGPIAIEAALYARFLGYYVELFEADRVAGLPSSLEDQRMPISLREATSSLGRAAMEAQGSTLGELSLDDVATYRQWVEHYLLPLARTDLIYDSVHVHSKVHSVSRLRTGGNVCVVPQERANDQFRLMIESQNRGEWSALVDVLLDCSGWTGSERGLGPGGGFAIGERSVRDRIQLTLPRSSQIRRGQHYLLWGSGGLAFEFLKRLASSFTDVRVTWFVEETAADSENVLEIRRIAETQLQQFAFVPCLGIESIQSLDGDRFQVSIALPDETSVDVQGDHLLSLPAPMRELSFLQQLSTTWTPLRHASVLDEESLDWEGWRLATEEPHYYLLGSKYWSRPEEMGTLADMHLQIRDLFALLGKRRNLDLYDDFAKREAR